MVHLQVHAESANPPPPRLIQETPRICTNLTTHPGRGRVGTCPPVPTRGYASEQHQEQEQQRSCMAIGDPFPDPKRGRLTIFFRLRCSDNLFERKLPSRPFHCREKDLLNVSSLLLLRLRVHIIANSSMQAINSGTPDRQLISNRHANALNVAPIHETPLYCDSLNQFMMLFSTKILIRLEEEKEERWKLSLLPFASL